MYSISHFLGYRCFILVGLFGWLTGCTSPRSPEQAPISLTDSAAVMRLIDQGDSLYALKEDYRSFANALAFYDSAARLAGTTNNVFLKGKVTFSKASIYNAWNREPQRTIELFKEAARIYATDPRLLYRSLYCRYLVAHAYDGEKGRDSTRCVQELLAIQDTLRQLPQPVWANWTFLPDLAWVATNANNYTLAEELLKHLTERTRVINDTNTNNYLDHYYLTRARIDVLHYQNHSSLFLDSLQRVFDRATQNFEKRYYSENLSQLYAAGGNYAQAYQMLGQTRMFDSLVSHAEGIGALHNRLLQTQLEAEKNEKALSETRQRNRNRLLWLLTGTLLIVSVLSYRFYRERIHYKAQSAKLEQANGQLDEKVQEIELLNKETQHRIKNNLQMIQSLVYLQQHHAGSSIVKQKMQEMGLRIQSIASLHDQLTYSTAEFIDLKSYLTQLIQTIVELVENNRQVLTYFDIAPAPLSQKQSFPLGLVLNEWITNSIKYAQPTGQSLSIHITTRVVGSVVQIDYRDSGVPVRQTDIKEGLGLSIIRLLTAQLKAHLKQEPSHFFSYQLTLPLDAKPNQRSDH